MKSFKNVDGRRQVTKPTYISELNGTRAARMCLSSLSVLLFIREDIGIKSWLYALIRVFARVPSRVLCFFLQACTRMYIWLSTTVCTFVDGVSKNPFEKANVLVYNKVNEYIHVFMLGFLKMLSE